MNSQGEAGDAATTKVLLVEKASQEFVFTEVPEKPVLSALRDFSAPVKLQVSPWHLKVSAMQMTLEHYFCVYVASALQDPINTFDSAQQGLDGGCSQRSLFRTGTVTLRMPSDGCKLCLVCRSRVRQMRSLHSCWAMTRTPSVAGRQARRCSGHSSQSCTMLPSNRRWGVFCKDPVAVCKILLLYVW